MKVPDRKVLKLGVQQQVLERFVQVHKHACTNTLSDTLTYLLDHYDAKYKILSD